MDKKKYSWKNKRQWIVLSVVAALMLTIMPMHKMQVRAEEKIIRVGYDANLNFIRYDGHEYYGYGVEYLEKIAEYSFRSSEHCYYSGMFIPLSFSSDSSNLTRSCR